MIRYYFIAKYHDKNNNKSFSHFVIALQLDVFDQNVETVSSDIY